MSMEKDPCVKSVRMLAFTYGLRHKIELAKTYFLMAIEKYNCRKSMHALSIIYKKQYKMELRKKYLIMSANLHRKQAKNELNQILREDFDLETAINIYTHLEPDNLTKLNKLLCWHFNNIDTVFNSCAIKNMCCATCHSTNVITVFLQCGHPICTKCFKIGITCDVCKTV